jgi:hypothetical protein
MCCPAHLLAPEVELGGRTAAGLIAPPVGSMIPGELARVGVHEKGQRAPSESLTLAWSWTTNVNCLTCASGISVLAARRVPASSTEIASWSGNQFPAGEGCPSSPAFDTAGVETLTRLWSRPESPGSGTPRRCITAVMWARNARGSSSSGEWDEGSCGDAAHERADGTSDATFDLPAASSRGMPGTGLIGSDGASKGFPCNVSTETIPLLRSRVGRESPAATIPRPIMKAATRTANGRSPIPSFAIRLHAGIVHRGHQARPPLRPPGQRQLACHEHAWA